MKFSIFGPFAKIATRKRTSAGNSRADRANPGLAYFAVDRDNFIRIETTFQSTEANDWSVVIVKLNESGRVALRLFDSAGATLATVVDLGGYAGLTTAVGANAVCSKHISMGITGSIANSVEFSTSLTDYTFFRGGRG